MACPPDDISITDLATYLLTSSSPRLLVGVVGAPGAGKSAVSRHLVAEINRRASADTAILVPLDGFHFTRHYLDTQMHDPVKAKRYRGAHWTFDKGAFSKCLGRLQRDDDVDCPEFDHRVHDPEEGKIKMSSTSKYSSGPQKRIDREELLLGMSLEESKALKKPLCGGIWITTNRMEI
ncbi:putative kinase [Perkinsus olseni]|uniref:Putative kinase n=1 Tax=Perkinsus olseni TaxID=32597 RepID=A0A7J6LRS3_PEROL|nr:putative kinase [Perkinsus olseni]KAF4661904.1 putative kinase [Perkinsus olseni]